MCIAHAIRDLSAFSAFQRIEEDSSQIIGQPLGISQPLGIRRPGGNEVASSSPETVLVHPDRFFLIQVHKPESQVAIHIGDFLAVRRPAGQVIKRRILIQSDLYHIFRTFLVLDMEHVFARFIREISDVFAVRRP